MELFSRQRGQRQRGDTDNNRSRERRLFKMGCVSKETKHVETALVAQDTWAEKHRVPTRRVEKARTDHETTACPRQERANHHFLLREE